MADAQLKAVISAEDRASKVIAGVSGSLDKVQDSLDKAKGASQAFAFGLAGVAAAGVAAGIKAITAAQESVQVTKQLEAVLKSTGGASGLFKEDILDQAAALQKLTNFGDEAIVSSANLLLTFTNIKGPIMQEAIQTTLDMSAALGQDLKSSSIQLGKALNDPIAGISALSRVGVTFNDDQKKVIQTLVDTGQTAKAQQVILDELAKEFGGSAQAVADPISQLKNSIGEAWEAIGMQLLPAVNGFAQAVRTLVDENINDWIDKTKEIIGYLQEHKSVLYIVAGAILGALVPAIYGAVTAFAALALELLPFVIAGGALALLIQGIRDGNIAFTAIAAGILTVFMPSLITLVTTIWTTTIPAIAALIVAFAPLLITGAVVAGLVAGILWIIKHWEQIKTKALEIWGGITDYLNQQWSNITTGITNAWEGIKNYFTTTWSEIADYVKTKIQEIKSAVEDVGNIDWSSVGKTLIEGFKTIYLALWSYVFDSWSGWFSAIADFFVKTYAQTAEGLTRWGNNIGDWFTSMPSKLVEWFDTWNAQFAEFINKTYDDITAGLNRWLDNLSAWFEALPGRFTDWFNHTGDAVRTWFNGLFEDPATVVAVDKSGTDMIDRLVESFDKNKLSLIGKWALILIGVIASLPLLLAASIITFMVDVQIKIVKAIVDNAPKIKDALVETFKNAFTSVIDAVGGWISQIIGKINSGLGQIKGLAGSAVSSVGSALGFRASGGAVNPNQSYIVGERGPELFTPNGYGSITRNSQLGGGGGITIIVNGDISGQDLIDKVSKGIMNQLKLNAQV